MSIPRKSFHGFTLIELLVVIAIIAILAAILFPVFAQAKAAAKKTQSLSNVKQLALAHMMYANDNDDTFVTSWLKEFPGDFNYFVQPYLKNLDILTNPDRAISPGSIAGPCSGDPWGTWAFGPGQKDNPTNLPYIWSYGFNNGYNYNNGTGLVRDVNNTLNPGAPYTITIGSSTVTTFVRPMPEAGIPTTMVVAPADTLMVGSTNGLPLMALDIDDLRPKGFTLYGTKDTPCESAARVAGGVDNGGYCEAYVDGHAKWLHFTQGKTGISAADGQGGFDPVAIPDACQYDSSYDGSTDTVHLCKEGYPNG